MSNQVVNVMRRGDEGFIERTSNRGRPDTVSPVMNPVLVQMLEELEDGECEIQLVPGDPFTVNQIRNWSYKGMVLIPDDMDLVISGGNDGQNIGVKLVQRERIGVKKVRAVEAFDKAELRKSLGAL